jgi:hypothetical protein
VKNTQQAKAESNDQQSSNGSAPTTKPEEPSSEPQISFGDIPAGNSEETQEKEAAASSTVTDNKAAELVSSPAAPAQKEESVKEDASDWSRGANIPSSAPLAPAPTTEDGKIARGLTVTDAAASDASANGSAAAGDNSLPKKEAGSSWKRGSSMVEKTPAQMLLRNDGIVR